MSSTPRSEQRAMSNQPMFGDPNATIADLEAPMAEANELQDGPGCSDDPMDGAADEAAQAHQDAMMGAAHGAATNHMTSGPMG